MHAVTADRSPAAIRGNRGSSAPRSFKIILLPCIRIAAHKSTRFALVQLTSQGPAIWIHDRFERGREPRDTAAVLRANAGLPVRRSVPGPDLSAGGDASPHPLESALLRGAPLRQSLCYLIEPDAVRGLQLRLGRCSLAHRPDECCRLLDCLTRLGRAHFFVGVVGDEPDEVGAVLNGKRSFPQLHLEAGHVREMFDVIRDHSHPLGNRVRSDEKVHVPDRLAGQSQL